MFLFLVLSFLLLVFIGSLKISNEESDVKSGLEQGELEFNYEKGRLRLSSDLFTIKEPILLFFMI